jgi:hypothetical protein
MIDPATGNLAAEPWERDWLALELPEVDRIAANLRHAFAGACTPDPVLRRCVVCGRPA